MRALDVYDLHSRMKLIRLVDRDGVNGLLSDEIHELRRECPR